MAMEYRQIGEIKEFRQGETEGEGLVEAYLTKWDSVDWYNSAFKKGAFTKSFRNIKMRMLFNHEQLIGKVIEAFEDDYGPFVRCKVNLNTRAGKDAWEHVRAKDIDCFSFGFNTVKDSRDSRGVRLIEEVECLEAGPVVFEANGMARITDMRGRDGNEEWKKTIEERQQPDGTTDEQRDKDYQKTKNRVQLSGGGYRLLDAITMTLEDNFYPAFWQEGLDPTDAITNVDRAITDFRGDYLEWMRNMFKEYDIRTDSDEMRSVKITERNGRLAMEARKAVKDIEQFAKESSFTVSELRTLFQGGVLSEASRSKLNELPEEVRKAHAETRSTKIEMLCSEIRQGGLSKTDRKRIEALLGPAIEVDEEELDRTVIDIRKRLGL